MIPTSPFRRATLALVLLGPLLPGCATHTPPAAQAEAQAPAPAVVLATMERVADWQLAHPSAHETTHWTQGVGDAGFMALANLSGTRKYRDAMVAMGERNGWQLGPRAYHADDHVVGQTYAELYLQLRDPAGARSALDRSEKWGREPAEDRRKLAARVDELLPRTASSPGPTTAPPSSVVAPPVDASPTLTAPMVPPAAPAPATPPAACRDHPRSRP